MRPPTIIVVATETMIDDVQHDAEALCSPATFGPTEPNEPFVRDLPVPYNRDGVIV
jgi:hypothetical protein